MRVNHVEMTAFGPFKGREDVDFDAFADDGIFLTEQGTLWQGELDGDSMTVVVSWAKGPKDHSAFEMTMTKQ